MLIQVSIFVAGLVALVFGASALVRGASKLALSFGISPLVVGPTIVAFGTSAPEMAVSTGAVLNGQTDIGSPTHACSCARSSPSTRSMSTSPCGVHSSVARSL